MKIRPLTDRVVVKSLDEDEMTTSGIIIPDTAKEKSQRGMVMAVGPGKVGENGLHQPMEVKEGDKVIFAKYAGSEFKFEGEELLILRESDVLAIL